MKRLLCLLLIVSLLSFCLAVPASSASSLAFVAVNDSVPLTLSGSSLPFYSGGILYLPYTAFDISTLGFYPSYNPTGKTLTLFNRDGRLVYDLSAGTVTDESKNTSQIAAISSGGMVYIPAEFSAAHFGVSVSFLTSQSGYLVVRFTTGSQVYDDDLFLEKAENLISYRASQQQTSPETPVNPSTQPPDQQTSPAQPQDTQTDGSEPEKDPAIILLALNGENLAQSVQILEQYGLTAAFFLTSDEIAAGGEEIRRLAASGCTIGLTVSDPDGDIPAQLDAANEALDRVLGRKTLLALLPEAAKGRAPKDGWCLLYRPESVLLAEEAAEASGQTCLLFCSGGSLNQDLTILQNAGCAFEQLRETTVLP